MTADLTLVNMASDRAKGAPVMPLGSFAIATTLEQAGYAVDLRDIQLLAASSASFEELAEVFATDAPVLGISVMSDRMAETVFALRLFKQRHPDTTVLVGGAGPTEVAEPLVRAFPFIDAVVRGEGEDTIVEVMAALRAGGPARLAGIPGVTVNAGGGRVVSGPERPRIRDVDRLSYPDRCRWDIAPYAEASLMTARGCPFRCSFCSVVELWGQQMGYRSIPRVVDEIEWLVARKPLAYVRIEDDTFTVNRKRILAFCDELDRRGLDIRWGCTGRIDMVDEQLVSRMHASGLRSMFLGVESGSDRARSHVLKGFTSRDVFDRVEMLRRYVEVTCHYIWGYPFETLTDFHQTFLHVARLAALGVHAHHSHLIPFPRSPLVREYRGSLRLRTAYPFPRLFVLDPGAPWLDEVRANPEVFMPYFEMESYDVDVKFEFVATFSNFERVVWA